MYEAQDIQRPRGSIRRTLSSNQGMHFNMERNRMRLFLRGGPEIPTALQGGSVPRRRKVWKVGTSHCGKPIPGCRSGQSLPESRIECSLRACRTAGSEGPFVGRFEVWIYLAGQNIDYVSSVPGIRFSGGHTTQVSHVWVGSQPKKTAGSDCCRMNRLRLEAGRFEVLSCPTRFGTVEK